MFMILMNGVFEDEDVMLTYFKYEYTYAHKIFSTRVISLAIIKQVLDNLKLFVFLVFVLVKMNYNIFSYLVVTYLYLI